MDTQVLSFDDPVTGRSDPTNGSRPTAAGWAPDPRGPEGRERWWDGRRWTARVIVPEGGGEHIAWYHDLTSLTAPPRVTPIEIRWSLTDDDSPARDTTAAVAPELAEPVAIAVPAVLAEPVAIAESAVETRPETISEHDDFTGDIEPGNIEPGTVEPAGTAAPDLSSTAEVGDGVERASVPAPAVDSLEAEPVARGATVAATRAKGHRRLIARPLHGRRLAVTVLSVAAVVALLAVGVAASAGVLAGGGDRPTLAPTRAYRDPESGFALRYPDGWRILRSERGESLRFAISAPGAPLLDTNTVSVAVGAEPAPLPALHALANEVTERLRERFDDIRLEAARRPSLAGAPALYLQLSDAGTLPSTRIVQVVGRTTAGHPLTVTETIREPRTAPTDEELRDFLASLTSAGGAGNQ